MFTTLIDAAELAGHLDDPAWVVIDCRFTLTDPAAGRRAYDKGHIPGARYADLEDDLSAPVGPGTGRHPLPAPEDLARRLGQWGIGKGVQVVVYDDIFGAIASRLWWMLRWLGHDAVAVLDGGLPAWRRTGHPLSTEPARPVPATFVPQPRSDAVLDTQAVALSVQAHDVLLIDARAEERFLGEIEPLDPVAGHIPGAVNWPYEENLALDGRFLSAMELRRHYAALLGRRGAGQAVHMCGSGVTACHNLLAMEYAGLSGSRLYGGSWSAWISDPSRPVAQG